MALRYLTVQDILWINHQVAKDEPVFKQERVEEASYYQYAYGQSSSLVPQAGRFMSRFAGQAPFWYGNDATAFVAAAAFLRLNGLELTVPDANGASWYQASAVSIDAAIAAIEAATKVLDAHAMTAEVAVKEVLRLYPQTVESLAAVPA